MSRPNDYQQSQFQDERGEWSENNNSLQMESPAPVSYEQDVPDQAGQEVGYQNGDVHDGEDSLLNSTIATEDTTRNRARLYAMCESALPRPEEQGRPMTAVELARYQEVLENTWDAIREWMVAHPSPDDRSSAATYQGQFMTTPLHILCKLQDPPPDIVESLVDCSREPLTWADSNGWLPLHHACANGDIEVLRILVEAYPESKVAQDRRGRTPLHFAFSRSDNIASASTAGGHKQRLAVHNPMVDIVSLLSDTNAAEISDEGGMLPMHYACAYGTGTEVLEVLADAYPDSVFARENKGRTPLHLAMVNAHRNASPGVLKFLLGFRGGDVVNMSDREGHLPLHLLSMSSKFKADQVEARANVSQCLSMYLDARPKANADFLAAIQSLPEWLQDDAVVSPHVQNILNEKIVKRFPTSILMLDGYMLILIIVSFEIASKQHIDYRFANDPVQGDWTLAVLFIGGSYFLLRELVQMISLWSLGTFTSWFTDLSNWLDVTVIFLVFYYSALMKDGTAGVSNDMFRSGVAFTKGVLWCAVISFLKSTLVDFAVFVGGVIYVVRGLAAFMLALGVILLAFAQMFLIVYKNTSICPPDYDSEVCYFPHCTFPNSLLKVITMLMGEVGDYTRYETSRVAQFLYLAYAFLVVILLSNVLIAIVTDSYDVIKNDRAAIVFWSNRLDFVAEMDAIASVRTKFPNWMRCSGSDSDGVPGAPTHVQEGPGGSGIVAYGDQAGGAGATGDSRSQSKHAFSKGWQSLMSLFDSNLYTDLDMHPGSFEFWSYSCFRFIVITVIIPIWLVLGLATAGWLWPPQVREFLFVQKKTAVSRSDMLAQVSREIEQLKDEIKELRFELKDEMKNDRTEMVNMKGEVEDVQREVMSDLLQVKEIMTTLLEMSRTQVQMREERASAEAIAAASGPH